MPEAVRLSVSEVRRAIYRAAGGEAGEGSTAWLGQLFHEVFARLLRPGGAEHWSEVLDVDSTGDVERLREHVWAKFVGPRLRQNQGALQQRAREVLHFWEAIGHLCAHVSQLVTNSIERNAIQYDNRRQQWVGLEQFAVEQELRWRMEEPGWTAPVEVRGVADAIWRSPGSASWRVIELKLGGGSPEADRMQLCLYYEMTRKDAADHGQLALFRFDPGLESEFYSGESLTAVREKLIDLIGGLARVKGGEPRGNPKVEYVELGNRLVEVMAQYGPTVKQDSDPVVGPTFLRFHIMPEPGVKVSRLLGMGPDLAVQLRLRKQAMVRLEGGRVLVDIERLDRERLEFGEFRRQLPERTAAGNALLLVGVDLQRQPRYADLSTEAPHVLAAGTAGSGKSEWLRTAMASLLATNTPDTLRVMLIDPKRVTFQEMQGSPYLLDPMEVLFQANEALEGLLLLAGEMERRYRLFAEHGCTDLRGLQARMGGGAPPRIVCFCDEYGNLVAEKKNRERIEGTIQQLGAKARAAGIHLVIATQDPRARIVSPTLKANLGARVCLKTTSATQSRMMLEENGAEALLGNGDLLFKTTGEAVRLQAPLLGEEDRRELFAARAVGAW